jgi:hypothetical protein
MGIMPVQKSAGLLGSISRVGPNETIGSHMLYLSCYGIKQNSPNLLTRAGAVYS